MGWSSVNIGGRKINDYFLSLWESEANLKNGYRILASGIKNFHVWYAALQLPSKEVIGLVYLVQYNRNSYYNLSYKEMDETCGPNECECPARILKLLTPTNNEFALSWRKKCIENLNKRKEVGKFKVGSRVVFDEDITFRNGDVLRQFTVTSVKPLRFNGTYRISRNFLKYRSFVVVQ